MKLVKLVSSNVDAWALMPYAIGRCVKFVQEEDGLADPKVLAQQIVMSFVSNDPVTVCFVLLDDAGKMIGHLLAVRETWMGTKMVTIAQIACDIHIPDDVAETVYADIEAWGRAVGAKEFHAVVNNEALTRVFARRYGFTQTKYLMSKPIAVDGEGSAATAPPKA